MGYCEGALLLTLNTPQLSLVVGVPNVTFCATFVPGLFVVVTSGGQTIVGNCVSRTMTVNVQVLLLPAVSTATFVTVVVPTGNEDPLAGVLFWLATLPQLSEAVTLNVTLLAHAPAAALTVMFVGQLIVGACLSSTVTVNEH